MSNYNESADEAEKQLSNISSSMCYAKWLMTSIHLTNGMTQSCYHPPLHKINIDDIKQTPAALHNTTQKKSERTLMLKGERPAGCSYCWKIEDQGHRSDRIYRSGEYWAQNGKASVFETLDTDDVIPTYIEVNFNQACNFKCMYCSPHLSTEWEDEVVKHGPYNVIDYNDRPAKHNELQYLNMPLKTANKDNPYVEAFWRWWPEVYPKLEVFRMTGGEPLMDANMYKVLDYINEHPNSSLELSITTNMCPPKPELMDKFIEKIKKLEEIRVWNDPLKYNPGSKNHWYVNMLLKHVSVFVSLDSVGHHAEYIRYGLNYATLQSNVIKLLSETCNTSITFINTFNVLSVPKITDYLKYILELRLMFSKEQQGIKSIPVKDEYSTHTDHLVYPSQRIWFDVPLLRSPAWQSINILPSKFESYIEDAIMFMKQHTNTENFVGFYDFEIEKLERNLAFIKNRDNEHLGKLAIDRFNFGKYFEEYDNRKGTSFRETFPELAEFYTSCL